MTATPNEIGNFTLRLGYITACLHSGDLRDYVIRNGATPEQVTAAYEALVAMADAAFYQKSY